MSINLLQKIRDVKGIYPGAVLFTFTLDLLFFEQIVLPRLYEKGCTNIVLFCDEQGYQQAYERGRGHLTEIGRRYVCVPLRSGHRGVQHIKTVMLIGKQEGFLITGSGNLTLSGFGRNLELFDAFTFAKGSLSSDAATFQKIWSLINQLPKSLAAQERLNIIAEVAPWLAEEYENPRIWDNFTTPLIDRIAPFGPVDELQLIAPFHDMKAIECLMEELLPERLIIGIDEESVRFDAKALAEKCAEKECELAIRKVESAQTQTRRLHAKTIIGISKRGSWLACGSANITTPALLKTWQTGGNLELLAFRQSDDPCAFDDIWTDPLINISECKAETLKLQHDHDENPPALPAFMQELQLHDEIITGKFESESLPDHWLFEIQSTGQYYPIRVDGINKFTVEGRHVIQRVESGRLVDKQKNPLSAYHFIDQLHVLNRTAMQSYHTRIKEGLQTFSGSLSIFREMMDFLYDRIDPKILANHTPTARKIQQLRIVSEPVNDDIEPLPLEAYIRDEASGSKLNHYINNQEPYDRNILSLRDLLSLVLLRLTTEPTVNDVDEEIDVENSELVDTTPILERQQVDALHYLREYLQNYCNQYAQRLFDPTFIKRIDPILLFENNFTLLRVFLEFNLKRPDVFTKTMLRDQIATLWGAMLWTKALGVNATCMWDLLKDDVDLVNLVQDSGLLVLTGAAIAAAWEYIPSWEEGLIRDDIVIETMVAKELIRKITERTGISQWWRLETVGIDSREIYGFQSAKDVYTSSETFDTEYQSEIQRKLDKLIRYRLPTEEKYQVIFDWLNCRRKKCDSLDKLTLKAQQLQPAIFNLVQQCGIPKKMMGDMTECVHCYITLPSMTFSALRRSEIVVCNQCQSLLYWVPVMPWDTIR